MFDTSLDIMSVREELKVQLIASKNIDTYFKEILSREICADLPEEESHFSKIS